jgi:hypothetical protein
MGKNQVGLRDVEHTTKPRRLRLLAPLRYLAIIAPEKKFYDVQLPLTVGLTVSILFYVLEPRPSILGTNDVDGVAQMMQGFLMMAVPFLIGALATVALASEGKHLDSRAIGSGIFLDGNYLSLRQFVCYLLGYLCFIGLSMFIALTLVVVSAPSFVAIGSHYPVVVWVVERLATTVFFVACSAFAITVFWALYFLTEVVSRDL